MTTAVSFFFFFFPSSPFKLLSQNHNVLPWHHFGARPEVLNHFFLVMAYLAGPLRRHRLKGEGEHEAYEVYEGGREGQAARARVLDFSLSLTLWLWSGSPSGSLPKWRSAWGPGRVSQRLQAHAHCPLKSSLHCCFRLGGFPRRCNSLQCTEAVHCIVKCCARQFPKQGLIDWGVWF